MSFAGDDVDMLEGRLTPVWSDCMEHLDSDVRPPGRVLQIHEKLSSPSRKRYIKDGMKSTKFLDFFTCFYK